MNKMRMKTFMFFALVFFGALSFSLAAVEQPLLSDHLEQAKSYEEKAKVYEKMISEHEQMQKEYQKNFDFHRSNSYSSGLSPRHAPANDFLSPLMYAQMHKHCENIVKASTSLRKRMLEFADWHRKQAGIEAETEAKK